MTKGINSEPNNEEKKLINRIHKALDSKQLDQREGDYYYSSEMLAAFQKLAVETAALIRRQGAEDTCETLLNVARHVKGLNDTSWRHTSSLAVAFDAAIKQSPKTETKKPGGNPFCDMDLPRRSP